MLIVEETVIRQWICMIQKFLDTFGWFADSYVLDFYQENHWNCLPKSWQNYLPHLSPTELASFLDLQSIYTGGGGDDHANSIRRVPPLGLMAMRACTKLLSLPRSQDTIVVDANSNINSKETLNEFKNMFNRHVKLKKRHEIEQFCKIVSNMATTTNSSNVFDVGSGLGHLSRYLTYGCGLTMNCIDSVSAFGKAATKFDDELNKFLSKKAKYFQLSSPPSHHCLKLELNKHEKVLQIETNFGIIGLHSCGNLSPVIIHNFVNSPAKFLVSVGCCYMKLNDNGFPLSEFGKDLKLNLSYEAKEVACHALEQYIQNLKQGQVSKLMTHCYRAILETILIKHFGIRRAGLRGVRNCEKGSFSEYAILATTELENIKLTNKHLCDDSIDKMVLDWYQVVIFFSMRLLVANIVETLIVLDRSLFIKENSNNSNVKIVTLFNPMLSPRNFAIVADK